MKKTVLFVMESLGIGGAEKSLVTLLSMMDYKKYDVDLFLFRCDGAFLEQVPRQVNLLDEDMNARYFQDNFKTAWIKYLLQGDFGRAWHSGCWLLGCVYCRFIKRKDEYYGWNHLKKIYSKQTKKYDVVIGYLEKKSTYYIVDCVDGEKKISFMHTDYESIPHDEKLDAQYFAKLDCLAVVSNHTCETMKKHFPFLENKIHIIKNMVSPEVISCMSKDDISEFKKCNLNTKKIVTVGRLTYQKGIDNAIDILYILRNSGIDVEWFVIGEGEEREKLESKIKKMGLHTKFHLLGAKSNPYPYIRQCDIYVQPSRWEGYGITVAEAKVLCKPIVASDIPEFREQLVDGVTGRIVMEKDDFVKTIEELIEQPELGKQLEKELKKEKIHQDELIKFYEMIEG